MFPLTESTINFELIVRKQKVFYVNIFLKIFQLRISLNTHNSKRSLFN